jgi:putative MATE family efflux protein
MKTAAKGPRLAEGPVGSAIVSMMVPMLLGMIAIVINNLAGAFFVARISTEQLAAVSFTFPVSFIVGSVSMGIGIGTSSVVSRLFGSGNRDEVRRVTLHAMLLGLAVGLVVLAAGLATIDPVFRLLGANETTLPLIHRYMSIYYFGGIFLVVPMVANSVLRASGDARRPMMIMTTAAVLNILIDPVLIFGLFGFPRMEIAGAALGAVISNALTMFASGYFVIARERLVDLSTPALALLGDSWRRILHVGIPSMTSSLIAPLTTAFITWQIARFGQEAVAGFGVASRIEALAIMALMALSAGMTPFVGQNFGARRLDRIDDGMRWSYRFAAIYGLCTATVLIIGAPYIAALFTDDPAARTTAVMHLRIVPLGYIGLGIAMSVNGALNAMGKPVAAMWVSLARTALVYAPLAFLLANLIGLMGIFIAAAIASLVSGAVGYAWFRAVFRAKAADQARAAQPQAA